MNNPRGNARDRRAIQSRSGATGVQVSPRQRAAARPPGVICSSSSRWRLSTCRSGCTRPVPPIATYPGEKRSRYDIWWLLAGRLRDRVAMARLLFSGLCRSASPTSRSSPTTWVGWCRTSRPGSRRDSTQLGQRTDDRMTRRLGSTPTATHRLLPHVERRHRPLRPAHAVECGLECLRRRTCPFGHGHAVPSIPRVSRICPRHDKAVNDIHVSERTVSSSTRQTRDGCGGSLPIETAQNHRRRHLHPVTSAVITNRLNHGAPGPGEGWADGGSGAAAPKLQTGLAATGLNGVNLWVEGLSGRSDGVDKRSSNELVGVGGRGFRDPEI